MSNVFPVWDFVEKLGNHDVRVNASNIMILKEYYEIVGESRPLSAFFPTHADFFTEMHFYS